MGLDDWDERMNVHESEAPRSSVEGRPPPRDDFFNFYETVLSLSNAMGRVEERSKAQGEELKKAAEKLEKVSRDVYGAKVSLWIVGTIIVLSTSLLGWLINNALTVLRIFLPSP